MIEQLQRDSATWLRRLADVSDEHPVWSNDKFKKFLSTPEDVERTICYVQEKPVREDLPPKQLDFVQPYRGEWSSRK